MALSFKMNSNRDFILTIVLFGFLFLEEKKKCKLAGSHSDL